MQTNQIPDTAASSRQVGSMPAPGARARSGLSHPTSGACDHDSPRLLYSQSRLPSQSSDREGRVAGVEPSNGRHATESADSWAAYYPIGKRTGVRPVYCWIDTETQLFRRVVLRDTWEGENGGTGTQGHASNHVSTTKPQANPRSDDPVPVQGPE
jgi:hypothetical protein